VRSGIRKDWQNGREPRPRRSNVYSRDYEDQADRGTSLRVRGGLRLQEAPKLWCRFAEQVRRRQPDQNFFFGDHSLSSKRAARSETEIRNNYRIRRRIRPRQARLEVTIKAILKAGCALLLICSAAGGPASSAGHAQAPGLKQPVPLGTPCASSASTTRPPSSAPTTTQSTPSTLGSVSAGRNRARRAANP
jgi:hypothetical protein